METLEIARILNGLFQNISFGNVNGFLNIKNGVIESMDVSMIRETRFQGGSVFRQKGDFTPLTRYGDPLTKTPLKTPPEVKKVT